MSLFVRKSNKKSSNVRIKIQLFFNNYAIYHLCSHSSQKNRAGMAGWCIATHHHYKQDKGFNQTDILTSSDIRAVVLHGSGMVCISKVPYLT